MVQILFLHIPMWRTLLIFIIHSDTFVYPFFRNYKCPEITNMFLTVPYDLMLI